LPSFEIFKDVLEEMEALNEEILQQPGLFDEVSVITNEATNRSCHYLIQAADGPPTNWYFEEEPAAVILTSPTPHPSETCTNFTFQSERLVLSTDVNTEGISSINENDENSSYFSCQAFRMLSSKTEINEIKEKEEIKFGKENEFTYIASNCVNKTQLIQCIRKYTDCFMWQPSDITGIDPTIAVHKIPTYPEAKPVKQKLRRVKTEWSLKIKEEVAKQLQNGFIESIEYPTWLANIVPVPKKDEKVRMCVDYRDLNKACPKDDFPLPHIDLLVDRMAGQEMVSLTDLAVGYNQIMMHPPDKGKTTFITEWGTYC